MNYEKAANETLCGIFCLFALVAIVAIMPAEYSDQILRFLRLI